MRLDPDATPRGLSHPAAAAPGGVAARREAVLGLAAAVLGAAFWLAFVAWQGFRLSPDSMSYAALARGFATGQPFSSTIYWRGSVPGGLQGNWPPLYPMTIALAHAFGLSYPWAEFVLSGLGAALACGFGAAALHRATGALPLAALVLLASFYDLLYVAGWGWSEPGFDALLSILFWLCARAARATLAPAGVGVGLDGDRGGAGARRGGPRGGAAAPVHPVPQPLRLLFWCGFVGGLAYLQRYAAAPFIVGVGGFAAALGLLAPAAGDPPVARGARALAAAAGGVAVSALPWTLADLAATGHLGTAYLPVGAGWAGAWTMTRRAVRAALRDWVHPGLPAAPAGRAVEDHLLLATAACVALGLLLAAALRRWLAAGAARRVRQGGTRSAAAPALGRQRAPSMAPHGASPPAVAVAGLLVFCAAGYAVFLAAVRARYFFDPIDLRLIAPGAWTALLAVLLLVSVLPAAARELAAVPLAAVLLLHGAQMARLAWRSPQVASSLDAPLCVPGPTGDCSLFAWLHGHLDARDLLVTNAPFTINLALSLPVQQVSTYPYDPYTTPAALRRWAGRWLRAHTGGGVYVVVDTAAGPVDVGGYGGFFAQFATVSAADLGAGWRAGVVASGPAWRVLQVAPP